MNLRVIAVLILCCHHVLTAQSQYPSPVRTDAEPIAHGRFAPTWGSLQQYVVPEWFRNAKFGIWAHWGPQCQPEQGDWYARSMYQEGTKKYLGHRAQYGHPSRVGFKDVIHAWKAEHWDPDSLVRFYKRCGAKYFFAMANHHDNLDLWNSRYQPWNSVTMGPKKDIIAGWEKAARANGLPFGVSVHAAHAWTWYETSQRSDSAGDYAHVPYDGKLTKADGTGTWWEGYDPQDLYAQDHQLSANSLNNNAIHSQWNWGNGASIPSRAYCEKFYNRTMDLINTFHPDLIYFDDTALPLYPVSDAGLDIAAHFYNSNMALHQGTLEAVLFGKVLSDDQKRTMVWDVERGAPDKIQEIPWQTCTCIGDWHYDRSVYEKGSYKSARTVIQMLVDVVSKNGNMLLNIPVRGNGTIDEKEIAVLQGVGSWMDVNGESIFGTRPWKVFGEGPTADSANPIKAQGFNEGKAKYSARDIRFTTKGNMLYATVMGVPREAISIRSLGKKNASRSISKIELLGSGERLAWRQNDDALTIERPATIPNEIALVLKIEFTHN